MGKQALGRGLGALIPGSESMVMEIDLADIKPSSRQPRKKFSEDKMGELVVSIREKGVLQPILLRRLSSGYEIVVGERRWRAALKAGLKKIPAIIKEVSDRETVELALIENLQREDLNPLEEAEAYRQLIEEFGLSQEEMATRVGKDRSTITNILRLLRLPPFIQGEIRRVKISLGHARALLSLENEEQQIQACKRIISRDLSVRQTEQLVRSLKRKSKEEKKKFSSQLENILEELQRIFGTRVRIRVGKGNKGAIEIEFYSPEERDRILEQLLRGEY
jgi:ParB family chromosome partitioning protein